MNKKGLKDMNLPFFLLFFFVFEKGMLAISEMDEEWYSSMQKVCLR
jgi:hypothetical protein